MKKALSYVAASLTMLLIMGACTRNHGDIGPWFGTWHVEQITAAGTPVNVEGDYFFQFQSHVFRVTNVSGHQDVVESFGTWREDDDGSMTIDFPDSTVYYILMPGLEAHNHFVVGATMAGRVNLVKEDANGTVYTYSLHRQP